MTTTKPNRVSHLFLVRLWLDQEAPGETEQADNWRGKVQHVLSGRVSSFSTRESMAELLADMLSLSGPESGGSSDQPGTALGPTAENHR